MQQALIAIEMGAFSDGRPKHGAYGHSKAVLVRLTLPRRIAA